MLKVMMNQAPAKNYADRLIKGGVDAVIGFPLNAENGVVDGLPAEQDGVEYLVSRPAATALKGAKRGDIWALPPDASQNAPAAFGYDYLEKVV